MPAEAQSHEEHALGLPHPIYYKLDYLKKTYELVSTGYPIHVQNAKYSLGLTAKLVSIYTDKCVVHFRRAVAMVPRGTRGSPRPSPGGKS